MAYGHRKTDMNPAFLDCYYVERSLVTADELLEWLGDWA